MNIDEEYEDYFEAIDMNDGDESTSVQAWQGSCFEPNRHNKLTKSKPKVTYEIEYVYGARMEDARKNVHISSDGKIVYMAACLGIVFDIKHNQQKIFGGGEIDLDDPKSATHFNGHTDEILCLELDDKRSMVASGQIGNKPYVFLWDANTGEKITRIRMNSGVKGISSIWFSPEGDKIACLDVTPDHCVWIYDIDTRRLLKVIQTDSNQKFDIDWSANPDGQNVIGVAGLKDVKFIKSSNTDFSDASIEFGITNRKYINDHVCVCFDDYGNAYSGTRSGFLYKWVEHKDMYKIVLRQRSHLKCVHSIKYANGNLLTGGGDWTIKVLSLDFTTLCILESQSTVRSVDFHNGLIVYSTKNGGLFKYDFDMAKLEFKNSATLMKSHFAMQECGMSIFDDCVYTSGDDNQMIVRNYKTHDITGLYKLHNQKKEPNVSKSLLTNNKLIK